MKCAVHPDVDAAGYCRNCGKAMCRDCVRPVRDVLYCEDCLASGMGHSAHQLLKRPKPACRRKKRFRDCLLPQLRELGRILYWLSSLDSSPA